MLLICSRNYIFTGPRHVNTGSRRRLEAWLKVRDFWKPLLEADSQHTFSDWRKSVADVCCDNSGTSGLSWRIFLFLFLFFHFNTSGLFEKGYPDPTTFTMFTHKHTHTHTHTHKTCKFTDVYNVWILSVTCVDTHTHTPDSRVLCDAYGVELLCKQWVYFAVDGHQFAQRLGSSEPHCPAGVLECLQEDGLQLGQEGLQGNAHLRTITHTYKYTNTHTHTWGQIHHTRINTHTHTHTWCPPEDKYITHTYINTHTRIEIRKRDAHLRTNTSHTYTHINTNTHARTEICKRDAHRGQIHHTHINTQTHTPDAHVRQIHHTHTHI